MNRIAWLGQASACLHMGIPCKYRSGYFLLSEDQRKAADLVALDALNQWLRWNDREPTDLEGAGVNMKADQY